MQREITIQARWDGEASVWLATSDDVPGLVVEADTWPGMTNDVELILPELLEVAGQGRERLSLTFERKSLAISPQPDGGLLPRPGEDPARERLHSRSQ